MHRRDFVKLVACGTGAALLPSCGRSPDGGGGGRRVFVVAFDGMDPRIVRSLMDAGKLPNYSRLAAMGSFRRWATSTPPHTPVAFSSIISGADPGVHQIFDFIHRHPDPPNSAAPVSPFFSTAEAIPTEPISLGGWQLPRRIPLGNWQLPLVGDTTEMRRRGPAFWDYLVGRGIDTEIYYLPSNYPTEAPEGPGRFRAISGMGTPDLLGGYGEFTFYGPDREENVGGGRFVRLFMRGKNNIRTQLEGPANFLRNTEGLKEMPMLSATLDIVRDPSSDIAKITLSGSTVMLARGEWSEWIPVEFSTGIPGAAMLSVAGAPTSVTGMVRLYMKQVHPDFQLYVSPINIDPLAPVNEISSPADFSRQMATRHGRFCTVGIPEDTKSLTHGALNEDEFLAQCDLVMKERVAQYRQALADFRAGCLFFYFGATDLVQHMFWRDRDERHPGRDPKQAERYAEVIVDAYIDTDKLVGDALEAMGQDDTLIVMSDHGFTSFRRGFNLNSWLRDNDYIQSQNFGFGQRNESLFSIDWSGIKAYGLGMNALYVNAAGREKYGVVQERSKRSLLAEIQRQTDGSPRRRRYGSHRSHRPGRGHLPGCRPDARAGLDHWLQ